MVSGEKLDFPGPIAPKGASADTVRANLKELHEKLKALEQERTNTKSLSAVRKQLLDKPIFLHKDKGIKAYCACCLADMLRLYAPDPPYNEDQLKDIFTFMLTQVTHHLKASPSTAPHRSKSSTANTTTTTRIAEIPYYAEYYYLLDSLATIRSICLVTDLPGGSELTSEWIIGLFSIVRPDMNKHFLRILQEIMTSLLDEIAVLPDGLLEDVLLNQLVTFKDKPEHPIFILTVGVMRNCASKIQRNLQAYVAEAHDRHGKNPTEADLKELGKVHDMLILLFSHAPEVLLTVVPQLGQALQGDDAQLRVLTTKTLGHIFGSPSLLVGGQQTVADTYHGTWQVWMGRRADKSALVRVAWIEAAAHVLSNHPEMRQAVEAGLVEKLMDIEDRVRVAACKTFGSLEYEVVTHHVGVSSLKVIGDRLRDKKSVVSEQAMTTLGKLYTAAFSEIADGEAQPTKQFGWIPQSIYRSLLEITTPAHRQLTETITHDYILPAPSSRNDTTESQWVERLLVVTGSLDEASFKSLMTLSNLPDPALQPWNVFIKACEAHNGGVIDKDEAGVKARLSQIVTFLASRYAEPFKAEKDLKSFAELNDKRVYKLFNTMMNMSTDIEGVVKAQNEITKRLDGSLSNIVPTIQTAFKRASFWIINRCSISHLIKHVTKPTTTTAGTSTTLADGMTDQARRLLLFVSRNRPDMLVSHVAELQAILIDKKKTAPVQLALQCLAQAGAALPKGITMESRLVDLLVNMCRRGTPEEGKYAARLIASSQNPVYMQKVVDQVFETLDLGRPHDSLLAVLAAGREMMKRNVEPVRSVAEDMVEQVKRKVLNVVSEAQDGQSSDESWKSWQDLDEFSQAKILALKLCISYCLMGLPAKVNTNSNVEDIVKGLYYIVANAGQVDETTQEVGAVAGHLRLTAANGLTKMAMYQEFDKMISNSCFEEIGFQIQDAYFPVRQGFLLKLHKYLLRRRHSPRWYILPFLVAHDVEQEIKDLGVKIVRDVLARINDKDRIQLVEKPFVRLLSLLTHHPDFETTETEDLLAMSQYINLYVDEVATKRNFSFLYHLANRIKTVQDIESSGGRLYMLSEMAQLLLQQKAHAQQISIDEYNGKQNMPSDIFTKLPSEEVGKKISRRQFLPDGFAQQLSAVTHKRATRIVSGEKPVKVSRPVPPRKRSPGPRPVPRRKKQKRDDDSQDTAGEETPDTEDYEDVDEDGTVMVKSRAIKERKGTKSRGKPQVEVYDQETDDGSSE